ncbi:MAG: hypothetical protein LBH18_06180 [Spirochaetaceae bacterium]|jgi:hypothetical protein|nr:hypothetical protein [Spirochaetaceae bacterium]
MKCAAYSGNKWRVLLVIAVTTVFAFCTCETVLWNDLAAQGKWRKNSRVRLIDKMMLMEIDNTHVRWKEEGTEDWEEELPCAASFGIIYLQFPEKTIKGSYFPILNRIIFSGFTWDDELNWLNGSWEK